MSCLDISTQIVSLNFERVQTWVKLSHIKSALDFAIENHKVQIVQESPT